MQQSKLKYFNEARWSNINVFLKITRIACVVCFIFTMLLKKNGWFQREEYFLIAVIIEIFVFIISLAWSLIYNSVTDFHSFKSKSNEANENCNQRVVLSAQSRKQKLIKYICLLSVILIATSNVLDRYSKSIEHIYIGSPSFLAGAIVFLGIIGVIGIAAVFLIILFL